jgi:type IV pilus assembly protein PilX
MAMTRPLSIASRHHAALLSNRQGGFSLIVALMMLIVIIILGISGSQMAINEERGSRADRDRQIAFQAAEAALKDAEAEINGPAAPFCTVPNQPPTSHMRPGQLTCFNKVSAVGFLAGCSGSPNEGLCAYNDVLPAYLDGTNVNFLQDAKGGGNGHTVKYGKWTGKTFVSQETVGAAPTLAKYSPRYIIERVQRNVTTNSAGDPGWMFRVTAMGFGANENAQVVLQITYATPN